MKNKTENILDILVEGEQAPPKEWQVRLISNGDCLSYGIWNLKSKELLYIDPKQGDLEDYLALKDELRELIEILFSLP